MSQPIIGISGNHYKTGDHTEPPAFLYSNLLSECY